MGIGGQANPGFVLGASRLLSKKGPSPISYANISNRRNLDLLVSRLRSSKHAAATPNFGQEQHSEGYWVCRAKERFDYVCI